ncbi:MAG: TRAP transporter substrate-binding protein [Deltaproteobacteria bacterium]|nr:TRAP transporter substrate-binding protein [Deltaproteobacteria bacterium]MBW2210649.1 TRAP transporter substrate-binding protein [Deltaproteobacteria bacterium]MBW2214642.1 TRAP transporter substrate-binding protein [Deltaproteobacteria bacterium]MBW2550234.1 TRAP transporter substrate-binding protein [Deltaproteobacteria bacterium]MBW2626344.1 TRAP transporter substrate-binding protein [Deltaproteobacteria bacterium]
MRKSIVCAVALFALSFLFAAPAPASAQEYVLEMGTVVPGGSPWALQLKRLKKYIEEETNGRVKVKLRLGGSNERSLARRTQMGSKQGFAGSVGGLSSIVREVNVIEAPYLFDSVEEADKALDDPEVLKQVRAMLLKQKLVFALWSENGFRSYFSRRPIRTPGDMKGIRYRSQEAVAHVAAYRALGASPVTIDIANTMTSLQTGVVDGFDNTALYAMASTWYQGLDDGERNLFMSRHSYQPGIAVYSKKWFDTLPADIQKVLMNAPHDLTTWGREQVRKMEPVLLKNLVRYGYDIHEPTAAELQQFKDKEKGVPDSVAKQVGPAGQKLLKAVRAALAK